MESVQQEGHESVTIPPRNAERVLFFTDAVVAIAMTLLILPLMENVAAASAQHLSTAGFLAQHRSELFSFFLSFAVIGGFWTGHHRLWHGVVRLDRNLSLLNFLWLVCIVWLPIATAMVGGMTIDRVQALIYIGPMLIASLSWGAAATILGRHPEYREEAPEGFAGRGMAISLALVILYAIALIITLIWPRTGYLGMFALVLTGQLQRLLFRLIRRRASARQA